MSPPKALRQALAKTAQDMMDLPLNVPELAETRVSLADLPEALEDRALLVILEGPAQGLGLIALSPVLLAGLIEMQTMGRLGTAAVAPRRPTRTDAAMAAGFIDKVLGDLEEALAEDPDIVWAGGFRYASWLEDSRPLGLILEETTYRMFRVTVGLGNGEGREGNLLLVLPAAGRGPGPRLPGTTEAGRATLPGEAEARAARDWAARMQDTVMATGVQIEAVLHRLQLPIRDVLAFQPGTVLPVPMDALEQLSIIGLDGREVARGRLGQTLGQRAVRLTLEAAAEETGTLGGFGAAAARAAQSADKLSGQSPYSGVEETGEPASFATPMTVLGEAGDLPPLDGGEDGGGAIGALPMAGLPLLGGAPEEAAEDMPMVPMKKAGAR